MEDKEKIEMTQKTEDLQKETEEMVQYDKEASPAPGPSRTAIFWVLGGGYLIYTGYQLARGFIKGDESSSLLFLVIGIVFIITGAVLAYFGGKDLMSQEKEKKERQERGEAEPVPPMLQGFFGKKETERAKAAPAKTISERARMVEQLQEEADSSDEDSE